MSATGSSLLRGWRRWVVAWLVFACAGCATIIQTGSTPVSGNDPYEDWNRKVFAFNEALDDAVLKPLATIWVEVLPQPVRTGIGNFYANLADAWSSVNNLLQGKPVEAFQVAFRFGVNTVFGFAGVLDLASEMGIDRHYEDFGQTLAVWGFNSGPFLMWPLLGPSTMRDSVALPLNHLASPMNLFDVNLWGEFGIWSLQLVNTRGSLLDTTRMLDTMALDRYSFPFATPTLQRRRSLIYDGEPPSLPPEPAGDEPRHPSWQPPRLRRRARPRPRRPRHQRRWRHQRHSSALAAPAAPAAATGIPAWRPRRASAHDPGAPRRLRSRTRMLPLSPPYPDRP